MQYQIDKEKTQLRFQKANLCNLKLMRFSDASFTSIHYTFPQLGCILFSEVSLGQALSIILKSYKFNRVIKFSMSAEALAFVGLFGDAVTLNNDIHSFLETNTLP